MLNTDVYIAINMLSLHHRSSSGGSLDDACLICPGTPRCFQRGSPLTFQVSSPSGEGPHKGPQVHAWTWSRRPTFGPWATSLQYRAIYMTRHNGRAACHSRTTHGFDVTNHVNPSVHGQKPPTVRMARQWMTSSTSSLRHSCSIRLPNALGVANDAAERTAAAATKKTQQKMSVLLRSMSGQSAQ